MINVRNAKRITIIGGGTAGWFSALTMRQVFAPSVEIRLIESPEIGIIGVGEGGLINLISSLKELEIPIEEFARETGAAYKLGFAYEGWRDGLENDCYYHMFSDIRAEALQWYEHQIFPLLSMMVHQGIPMHNVLNGFKTIAAQGSQEDARQMLQDPNNGISMSYHFDSHRVAQYLQKVAVGRGVVHQQSKVEDVLLDEKQNVTAIQTTDGLIETDFVIDASGMARLVIGKKLKSTWCSFKKYLLLDRAIPFHMPHPKNNPYLVTRAIAMTAGWMWQIPLIERVGAGYVFSSQHITEEQALIEIEKAVGHGIAPQRTISFEPGHYTQVWQGNVMALGLASGFVEPLEATSIGQMLTQLKQFGNAIVNGHGIIPQTTIDTFNEANCRYWSGIRDFLRMHYDCPRRDTEFWRHVAQLPLPDSYAQLKQCFALRTPRVGDLKNYAINDWDMMFSQISWLMVGSSLGVILPESASSELFSLPERAQKHLLDYLNEYREKRL